MTRVVLVFGLIAGVILSAMMVVNTTLIDRIGFDTAEVIGYTTIVLAFLMVFFGIRSYRDQIYGGTISFGQALRIGVLITLVASACYVITWEVLSAWAVPDFAEKYAAHLLEEARKAGASEQELAARAAELAAFQERYQNPVIKAGYTFLEVFPIGLVVSLVSAGVLRRRTRAPSLAATNVRSY